MEHIKTCHCQQIISVQDTILDIAFAIRGSFRISLKPQSYAACYRFILTTTTLMIQENLRVLKTPVTPPCGFLTPRKEPLCYAFQT